MKFAGANTAPGLNMVAMPTTTGGVNAGLLFSKYSDVTFSVLGGMGNWKFSNVVTHNVTTEDGDCGSPFLQGNMQCVATHIGRGADPETGALVNFAVLTG
jgi:hypothetical protein